MKSIFRGKLHRLPTVLLWLLTASLLTTACGDDKEPTADYTAVDDTAIQKYIADNKITGAQKQTSGLYYVPVTTNANAPQPTASQIVSILYTGQLLDGTVFDATSKRDNAPLTFRLGIDRVIPGLEEGLALMHKGDKAVFLIPSGLAYGTSGAAPTIPANAVIRFEVELTDINTSYAIPDDNLIVRYLAKNNITTAQKQPSGLYFVPTVSNPTGTPASAGKTVSVLYTGKLLNGTVFDATSQRGNAPFSFVVGATPKQVIPGFDEGVNLMRKGEKATLLIPSALAYGTTGAGTSIGPNTVISFDIEVVDVK
ncbi:MAG: FKBP-type peptidyl-prolyl cis-trans isomerase [Hymenobacter sp.]|nr:MAG: FKBP-type peptidyl-prolyl cis-trans isomerase [Hymenobacter sp.]